MVTPARLERATLCLEGRCSIQLSYGAMDEDIGLIKEGAECQKLTEIIENRGQLFGTGFKRTFIKSGQGRFHEP